MRLPVLHVYHCRRFMDCSPLGSLQCTLYESGQSVYVVRYDHGQPVHFMAIVLEEPVWSSYPGPWIQSPTM